MYGSQKSAIVDKLLTGVSQAIMPHGFIGEEILTPLSVMQTTGLIGKYGNGHLRIQSNTVTNGRTKYPTVQTIIRDSDVYRLEMHGLQDIVTPDDYDNVEQPFDAESDIVGGMTINLQLGKEKSLADALTSTSIITQNMTLTGNDQYSNIGHADSTPLADALVARGTIRDAIGHAPNIAIMSGKVADNLSYHAAILDALGYKDNRAGTLSYEELARALKVDRVLVGEAVYNAAKEGQADDIQPVWGGDLVYAYVNRTAGKQMKTLGFDISSKTRGRRVVQKWAETTPRGANGVSVDDTYDQLLTDVSCAYLIKGAV